MKSSLDWKIPEFLVDLVDFTFRPICLVCREPVSRPPEAETGGSTGLLCARCAGSIVEIHEPICDRCGSHSGKDRVPGCRTCERLPVGLDRMRSAVMMGEISETLVHRFKYEGWRDLADYMVMKILESGWSDREFWEADFLVPVPISRVRRRERGYNQSALLAEGLSGRIGIPSKGYMLERVEWRRPQVGLPHKERLENVRDAFSVPEQSMKSITGKNIILVDDVITTGATVSACCRVLREAGAEGVSCVSFGRVDSGCRD